MMEQGWLVEIPQGRMPNNRDAVWMMVCGVHFGWTHDSLLALRFARKVDAEAMIHKMDPAGHIGALATEHGWGA